MHLALHSQWYLKAKHSLGAGNIFKKILFISHLIVLKYINWFFVFQKWLLPKNSIEIWDGPDVVRTRAVIRQRLQCIKNFMENCVGAKHISLKNSYVWGTAGVG